MIVAALSWRKVGRGYWQASTGAAIYKMAGGLYQACSTRRGQRRYSTHERFGSAMHWCEETNP